MRMLGILHDAVVFLTEQLSGAKHCRNYKFRFHKPEEANEPPLNPHGSARAEVHLRQVPLFSGSGLGSELISQIRADAYLCPFPMRGAVPARLLLLRLSHFSKCLLIPRLQEVGV